MNAPAIFPALTPGTVLLEKYRLVRELGSGGMGVVLAAEDLVLGRLVAIKFLLPELAVLPDSTRRFLREARAAARIEGEHIVQVLDYGTILLDPAPDDASQDPSSPDAIAPPDAVAPPSLPDAVAPPSPPDAPPPAVPVDDDADLPIEGQPFIVMEYLEGKDLGKCLKAGARYSIHEAIEYAVQTAEALAQAHRAGVIHRDVKPANLFLTERGDGRPLVKMLDFGISKVVEEAAQEHLDLTNTRAVMGSALYMSLEQMRSTRSVDTRTDIYSLGVSLYELLTGTHPFTADTFSEQCVKVSLDPPDPITRHRPEIPKALAEVIARAYARYPDDRYPTVGTFASALAPFAAKETQATIEAIQRFEASASGQLPRVPFLTPTRDKPVEPRRPWRVPAWLAGALFGALLAVGGFTYWLVRVDHPVLNPDAGAPTDASLDGSAPDASTPDTSTPDASLTGPAVPVSAPSAPTPSGSARVSPPPRPPECRNLPKDAFYVDARGLRRRCP